MPFGEVTFSTYRVKICIYTRVIWSKIWPGFLRVNFMGFWSLSNCWKYNSDPRSGKTAGCPNNAFSWSKFTVGILYLEHKHVFLGEEQFYILVVSIAVVQLKFSQMGLALYRWILTQLFSLWCGCRCVTAKLVATAWTREPKRMTKQSFIHAMECPLR